MSRTNYFRTSNFPFIQTLGLRRVAGWLKIGVEPKLIAVCGTDGTSNSIAIAVSQSSTLSKAVGPIADTGYTLSCSNFAEEYLLLTAIYAAALHAIYYLSVDLTCLG